MQFIDSHCHIYLDEFVGDRSGVIGRAREAGVEMILMPAIDASTHEKMLSVEKEFTLCRSMIGLHPCSVNQDYQQQLELVTKLLNENKFWAIGEIGLDFYWDQTFREQQFMAFEEQIQLAINNNLPVVIHSRNSINECIDTVEKYPAVRGVFHCFSGDLAQAKRVIETGLMLGIGGVATFKNGGLDEVLPHVGLQQVILETDAPYLAPVPYRGKRNEPAYVKLVAERLAQMLDTDLEEVAKITTENARKLFALN